MNKLVCIFFILLTFESCPSDYSINSALDREMTGLLRARDYFSLETALKSSGSQLSEVKVLYYKAHLESAFNQTEQSLQTIDLLFSKHKKSLNDMLIYNLLLVKRSNHIRKFEYNHVAETLYALSDLVKSSSRLKLDNINQEKLGVEIQFYEAVKNVPPQKIFLSTDAIIPFKKNEHGHLTTQIICNDVTEEFIFDTGASFSTISESVATRMGIRPLNVSKQVWTPVSSSVTVKIGVADSLRISDLLFENVVFYIIPDQPPNFQFNNYRIDEAIGFPLIYQMKEIKIDYQAGNIVVPQTIVNMDLHNIFLDNNYPIIRLESGQDTLLFSLDFGAEKTRFFKKYFDVHNKRIIEEYQPDIIVKLGLGGIIATKAYKLTNVSLKIDDIAVIFPIIYVETEENPNPQKFDGVAGQDLFTQFNEIILNFESMYLTFSDKKNNQ